MRKIIHITHNDGDAVGCDVLVRLMGHFYRYKEIESHFCNVNAASEELNKVLDNIDGKEIDLENKIDAVIISDISVNEETLNRLEVLSKTYQFDIFGCDHHATNHADENHKWFYVIPEASYEDEIQPVYNNFVPISATLLLYYVFRNIRVVGKHNDEIVKINTMPLDIFTISDSAKEFLSTPTLMQIFYQISDYDVYNFKYYPHEYKFKYYGDDETCPLESEACIVPEVTKLIGPERTSDLLYDHIVNFISYVRPMRNTNVYPYEFKDFISIIMRRKNGVLKDIRKKLVPAKVKVPIIADNTTIERDVLMVLMSGPDSNSVADFMYNNIPEYTDIWFLFAETRNISFRSSSDVINWGDFAKLLGGGGHPKASGANNILPLDFLELIKYVYTHPSYEELLSMDNNPEMVRHRVYDVIEFNKNENGDYRITVSKE